MCIRCDNDMNGSKVPEGSIDGENYVSDYDSSWEEEDLSPEQQQQGEPVSASASRCRQGYLLCLIWMGSEALIFH